MREKERLFIIFKMLFPRKLQTLNSVQFQFSLLIFLKHKNNIIIYTIMANIHSKRKTETTKIKFIKTCMA